MMKQVTRSQVRRGDTVRIQLRDGRTISGTVVGNGNQVMDIAPDAASSSAGWNWKRHAISVVLIQKVEMKVWS